MQTPREKKPDERSIKFAEAGILFVLILAVAIFVGVKMTSRSTPDLAVAPEPSGTTVTSVTSTSSTPVAPAAGRADAHLADGCDDATMDHSEVAASQTANAAAMQIDGQSPTTGLSTPTVITYATAEAAYFERRYDEAIELFTAYTNQHPENAWGHYMLGLACWKGDIPKAAEASLREALSLQPEHLKSLVNLGRVLLDLDRPEEAQVMVEKAVSLDPEYAEAYRVLGRVYHNLGQREEAMGAYQEAILRNDKDAWSLNNLGLLLIEQEEFSAAVAPLARAILLQDQVACFQNNLGIALERSGYNRLAAAAYTQALIIDGNYEKAAMSLDRVEGVADNPGLEEIDLAALGAGFRIESATSRPVPPAEPADPEIASTEGVDAPAEAIDPEIARAEAVDGTAQEDEFKKEAQ